MISSERVRLVGLDRERHYNNALKWVNDRETTEWLLVGDWPIGRLAENRYFDKFEDIPPFGAPTELALAIETTGGQHIGFTSLHDIEWRHRCATTGIMIGDPSFRGQGYGTETVKLRARYAFETLGLRMLHVTVFAENTRSLRMLEKAGYTQVGVLKRRYWRHGAFRDAIILQLLAE